MEKHSHQQMNHKKEDHSNLPTAKAGMNHGSGHNSNPSHGHMGHDHHKMMVEDFKKRFWISTIITIPILFFSPMIQGFFGYDLLPGNPYILFALSTFIYFWGGWPFLKGFYKEIKSKGPGMMTLISMAISVAYFYSSATVFGLDGEDFFWELSTLIVIMLLGHWLEMKSVLGASKALQLLVSMLPSEAHRVNGETIEDVKLEDLLKDDLILIKQQHAEGKSRTYWTGQLFK